jgi:hypothetical protein
LLRGRHAELSGKDTQPPCETASLFAAHLAQCCCPHSLLPPPVARKGPIFTEEEVKVKELAFPPSSLQANFTDPASSKKAQMLSLLLSTQEFFDPLLFLWLGPDAFAGFNFYVCVCVCVCVCVVCVCVCVCGVCVCVCVCVCVLSICVGLPID